MTEFVSINSIEGLLSYREYVKGGTNAGKISQMRKILAVAVKNELTAREREFLKAYYFEGLKIPKIAEQRGINKSTVSRALNRAKRKLKKAAEYYC